MFHSNFEIECGMGRQRGCGESEKKKKERERFVSILLQLSFIAVIVKDSGTEKN